MKTTATTIMAITASVGISSASTIMYDVDTIHTGATPTSISPWLTVTLVDVTNRATDSAAVADYVSITVTSNLTDDEFLSKVYLEIHPRFADASVQSITYPNSPTNYGVFEDPTITVGANEFTVGGGFGALIPRGGWDPAEAHVELNFNTSNSGGGIKRFNQSDSFTFVVGYDGPESMVAENLQLLYAMESPEYYAAAHIQGIVDGQSSWVTSTGDDVTNVPEPSTVLLGAFGILGILRHRRVK